MNHLLCKRLPSSARVIPMWMNMPNVQKTWQIWSPLHIHLLGPRIAVQVEGTAFQKICRLQPAKLRSSNGTKLLVESFHEAWDRPLLRRSITSLKITSAVSPDTKHRFNAIAGSSGPTQSLTAIPSSTRVQWSACCHGRHFASGSLCQRRACKTYHHSNLDCKNHFGFACLQSPLPRNNGQKA